MPINLNLFPTYENWRAVFVDVCGLGNGQCVRIELVDEDGQIQHIYLHWGKDGQELVKAFKAAVAALPEEGEEFYGHGETDLGHGEQHEPGD